MRIARPLGIITTNTATIAPQTALRTIRGHMGVTLIALALAITLISPVNAQKSKSNVKALTSQTAALSKRVQQLEEQLLDIQVMIGTLQSMAQSRGRGGTSASFGSTGGGGASSALVRGLETQIQALTAQVQQLASQVRGGDGRHGDASAYQPAQPYTADAATGLRPGTAPFPTAPPAEIGGFGTVTVTPGADDMGSFTSGAVTTNSAVDTATAFPSARSTRASTGEAKQMYERAYGYLLQQNFGGARTAFSQFLATYPRDPLAGNAQYWLGETYYVRQKYRSAANAFLKGYQSYGRSNKAPDSLLKLAMSLDRLGQKDAACSSYDELRDKFPRAPSHVKKRARSERSRMGC